MKESYSWSQPDTIDHTRLRREWGDFLGETEWDHAVTLTTRYPRSADWLRREFTQRYVRRLEKASQRRVLWFWVAEEHGSGQLHLHALVWGTASLDVDYLRRSWEHGFTSAEPYDPGRGAARYLSKTMGRERDFYDYSLRRPPSRGAQPRPLPHDFGEIGEESSG